MIRSILITKPLAEVPLLATFCIENDILLMADSFIRFEPVKAEIPGKMETIFFGSRRAAEFFLQQSEIPANCKVACIGETTKKHIENLEIQVDFCGSQAGNPALVAEELKQWLGNRKLFIALSEQSNRSMSKVLPASQVQEMIVYQTISAPKTIHQTPDVFAFTSPSNLTGFLVENQLPSKSQIIAWGTTTQKALNALQITPDFVLKQSTEQELITILADIS